MAITPIGNMVYVNQNAPTASVAQSQHMAKSEGQAFAAIQAFQDREKEVEEVRPTEESFKVDPDREHERERNEQELKEQEKEKKAKKKDDEEEEDQSPIKLGHLDIKV